MNPFDVRGGNYTLDDVTGRPIPCPDETAWADWFEAADRTVAVTQINKRCRVSTVFLGVDHDFIGAGEPVLWETMIFGGRRDGYQRRYTSREDAILGHARVCQLAQGVRQGWRLTGRQRTRILWRKRGRR